MEWDHLKTLCTENQYDPSFTTQCHDAYDFIRTLLADKKRLAGDTFFDHNCRVAEILIKHKAAPEIVLAGMLHGTVKYIQREELLDKFGEEIVTLIEEVQNIQTVKSKNEQLAAEALRKILLTTLKDVRVILIKLANKLDNLKSIHVFPPEDQRRIAQEVLDIYAPLGYRLGMDKLKGDLETLALKILHPHKYNEIISYLNRFGIEQEHVVQDAIKTINKLVGTSLELIKIKGRQKQVYSIYKKMVTRGVKLTQQYDLFGIRAIVPTEKECYTFLGLLHEHFEPVEGRLKDYIANPKPNFYRSLHTAIRLENGHVVEIQIRTPEMDEFAEEGIGAHWRYKGLKSDQFFEKKISWLRSVLDLQKDSKEFLETAKVDVFGDKIYCYTPKGDVKELPVGGTVLDFAYLVHEEVGNTTVGGRVNGTFVPLRHPLQQGDVVEIVTNKKQRPRRNWIKIVRSGRARQKIRKSLREHEKGIAPLHYRLVRKEKKEELSVLVESESFPNAMCILAKCCQPIPGDTIVGILTKRRVISTHRDDCKSALKEEDRWIPVNWKEQFGQKIQFHILAGERSGVLADLLHTIANAGFEVKEAKAKLKDLGTVDCSFLLIPRDLEHVQEMIARVKKVHGVQRIYFE